MRAFTASGPPAAVRVRSVALLSEMRSISSSRFRRESATPGSSNRFEIVPLPGWMSAGSSSTMSASEISPRSTRDRSCTAIGTL